MAIAKRVHGILMFDPDGYERLGCPAVAGRELPEGVSLGFGKHAGVPLRGVPTGYLAWVLSEVEGLDDRVRREATRVLRFRELRRVTPRPQGCEDMPGGPRERCERREAR